jgi:cytochrome P450
MRKIYRYGFDAPYRRDPTPLYGMLRSEEPVARVTPPYGEEAWLVTRHESVKTVLKDPRFSRAAVVAAGERIPRVTAYVPPGNPISAIDPPEHTGLRKLISGAFARFAVEQRRPRAQQIANELIDDMITVGPPLDLILAFAAPFQAWTMGEIFGIPQSDRPRFREWTISVVSQWSCTKQQVDATYARMRECCSSLIARKREQPGDDLISTLVLSHVDQQQIIESEVVNLAIALLVNDGVVNQLASGLYLLLTHPDQLTWLRANMSQVPEAVEKLLRFAPLAADIPIGGQGHVWMAMADVEIDGVCIRAGEFVQPSITSANRDERVFVDPHKLDLTRTSNPHIAFGIGPHHCLGEKLDRMEMQVAVDSLLTRFPNLQLAVPVDEVPWKKGMVTRGPAALPSRGDRAHARARAWTSRLAALLDPVDADLDLEAVANSQSRRPDCLPVIHLRSSPCPTSRDRRSPRPTSRTGFANRLSSAGNHYDHHPRATLSPATPQHRTVRRRVHGQDAEVGRGAARGLAVPRRPALVFGLLHPLPAGDARVLGRHEAHPISARRPALRRIPCLGHRRQRVHRLRPRVRRLPFRLQPGVHR